MLHCSENSLRVTVDITHENEWLAFEGADIEHSLIDYECSYQGPSQFEIILSLFRIE